MMKPLTFLNIQTAISGQLRSCTTVCDTAANRPVGRIVTDSREVQAGDVFWALAGSNQNGAQFAAEAYIRGAVGVVAEQAAAAPPVGSWMAIVRDSLSALWALAGTVRGQFKGQAIAVTGSVGKTTTRQMIHAVLGARLQGTASPRNYNNHVGVPLSLLEISPRDDYAVLELGASGLGEIARLAALVRPSVGVITSIGQAHLGGFGSQRSVAEAKSELLTALPAHGKAVLSGDDAWLRKLAGRSPAPIEWVGRGGDCSLSATWVRSRQGWLEFCVDDEYYRVPVAGRHYLTSALAAIAVGKHFKLQPEEIAAGLESFEAPEMRCQVIQAGQVTVINDAYNASPTAMQAGLELLRDFDHPGRKVVVCGDMRELGPESPHFHRRLGEQVVTICGADLLVACGEQAEEVVAAACRAGMRPDRTLACREPRDVLPRLCAWLAAGDALLLKGSRSMHLEQLLAAIRQRGEETHEADPPEIFPWKPRREAARGYSSTIGVNHLRIA